MSGKVRQFTDYTWLTMFARLFNLTQENKIKFIKRAPFHLPEQKHKRLILPNTGKTEEKGVLLIEQY